MNIKYIGTKRGSAEKGKIHIYSNGYTGCGIETDDNPKDWVTTNEAVTCERNGCKNK